MFIANRGLTDSALPFPGLAIYIKWQASGGRGLAIHMVSQAGATRGLAIHMTLQIKPQQNQYPKNAKMYRPKPVSYTHLTLPTILLV